MRVGAGRNKPIAGNSRDGNLWCDDENGYYGTCYSATTGKMDRKRFPKADRQKAIAEWTEWCKGVRTAEYEKMAAHCKLKDEKAAATATKEASNMEKNTTETSNMYVLTVVGGAPIYWFDSEDKAFAVCDALTAAAESSGFAAKYDVTVIKKWVA